MPSIVPGFVNVTKLKRESLLQFQRFGYTLEHRKDNVVLLQRKRNTMLTMLLLLAFGAGDTTTPSEVLLPTVVVGSERVSSIKPPEEKVAEFIAKDWSVVEESRPNDVLMECCYDYGEHQ